MKTSIMHVARKLIDLSSAPITPLKLQKLTYYCQAWSLVWEERPLFDEEFQAWANGPVNQELFAKHKGKYILEDNFLAEYSNYDFNDADMHTIQTVLNFYGDKEPFFLSELTHKERPWKEARGDTPLGAPSTSVISLDSMREYYTEISTR
ncbi:MAG: Panacea domain-containing protein [Acidobacteriota bacterium]